MKYNDSTQREEAKQHAQYTVDRVLVIIPAYNEEKSITDVVDKLIRGCPEYDYVVINDGSSDNTAQICRDNHYNLLDLPINLGLAGAFQTGLLYAYEKGYDYAIQFDADGQHRTEYIIPILRKAQEGYDVVIGSRYLLDKKRLSFRSLGSSIISLSTRLTTGKVIHDPTSGMRMFCKDIIRKFANSINYDPEPDTISYLIKSGCSFAEVPVEMDEREHGESYLTVSRSILYMVRMSLSILLIQRFRGSLSGVRGK